MKNILVPIDLTQEESWEAVFHQAIEFARSGGTLHVMTVVPELSSAGLPGQDDFGVHIPTLSEYNAKVKEIAQRHLDGLVEKNFPNDVTAETMVMTGRVHHEILKAADDVQADMIVMNAGRSPLPSFLLGMTVEWVARQAKCSVCIVRTKARGAN